MDFIFFIKKYKISTTFIVFSLRRNYILEDASLKNQIKFLD